VSRPLPRMNRVLDRLSGGRRRLAVATVAGVLAGGIAVPTITSGFGTEADSAAAAAKPQISKPAASRTGPAPAVRVNQVGYQTESPKKGTFVTKAKTPLAWSLKDAAGKKLADGMTKPAGVDPSSGENVHTFDFSKVTESGEGYTVTVGGRKSEPFTIADNPYSQLASRSTPALSARSTHAPPGTSTARRRATRRCPASRRCATTASTSAVAGTTRATLESTWSTVVSPLLS
jgi:endoglucanase